MRKVPNEFQWHTGMSVSCNFLNMKSERERERWGHKNYNIDYFKGTLIGKHKNCIEWVSYVCPISMLCTTEVLDMRA